MATRANSGGVRITVPATWIASWTLYDLANTIWSYGIFSYAIGLYLTSEGVLGEAQGNLWLQISIALSVGVNALVSPAIGALSDRTGRRLPYLLFFTALAIVPAILIPSVPVTLGVLLFCVANFGYQSALVYYDATIKIVSTPANRGWVSGLGNGLGYLGTVLIGVIILFGGLTVEQVFVVAPLLFAVLALPIFIFIREVPVASGVARGKGLSLASTAKTIRELGKYPGLRRFLIARFFYTDAQNTVISIMAVFAVQAVGFSQGEANYVLVALATTAVVGGLFWGRMTDRSGPKTTLRMVLTLWAIALVIGALFISPIPFIVAGVVLGFGFGGLAGADRILMLRLSPPDKLGEFYGLYSLVGKGSQVIGGL
ncbi:MAG: MFS transporter, partial [Candidatus Limnocylindrus sp.]